MHCNFSVLLFIFISVFPGTEEKVYNDKFYKSINIVINALDNVEARRYIDRY